MSRFLKPLTSTFTIKRLPLHKQEIDPEDDKTEPLMRDTSDYEATTTPKNNHKSHTRPFLLSLPALTTIILTSLLLGALALTTITLLNPAIRKALQQPPKKLHKPCGSTPSEARKAGCNFDVISFCWLPDACYDAELSRQFDDENRLEWFLDANRTLPLAHDEIMSGEYTGLYVNWEYHLRHCTAMWKKMHRAVLGGGRDAVDGYIGVYEHTEHCEKMLLGDRSIEWDVINTRIAVKFPDCGV
ncbi:hypothetical protein BDV25DRAFT_138089 [Aspergillus avenaceus]|uniref:Uncharacterized protein n=1 Tax=Aspergillus avenaceus TaxID=36643 RepID=A0A5N6U130_ASPAV|nr:hypothetical protein BDV25DRAFT_138089 [Aspergillus avenaceus]